MKPILLILTVMLIMLSDQLIGQSVDPKTKTTENYVLVITRVRNAKKWVFRPGSEVVVFRPVGDRKRIKGMISSISKSGIRVNGVPISLVHIEKIKSVDSSILETLKFVSGVATSLVFVLTVAVLSDDYLSDGAEMEVIGMGVGLGVATSSPLWFNNPKVIGPKFKAEILPINQLEKGKLVKWF